MATTETIPTKGERQKHAFAYAAHPLPETGFVRLPSILAVLPISRTAFLDGVKAGKYPRPIKIGPPTTVWKADDIKGLLAELEGGANATP